MTVEKIIEVLDSLSAELSASILGFEDNPSIKNTTADQIQALSEAIVILGDHVTIDVHDVISSGPLIGGRKIQTYEGNLDLSNAVHLNIDPVIGCTNQLSDDLEAVSIRVDGLREENLAAADMMRTLEARVAYLEGRVL